MEPHQMCTACVHLMWYDRQRTVHRLEVLTSRTRAILLRRGALARVQFVSAVCWAVHQALRAVRCDDGRVQGGTPRPATLFLAGPGQRGRGVVLYYSSIQHYHRVTAVRQSMELRREGNHDTNTSRRFPWT